MPRSTGLITKRILGSEGILLLVPVAGFDAARIKAFVLAAVPNTNPFTVRKWELGDKSPSGPSLKLLDLLEGKGLDAVL